MGVSQSRCCPVRNAVRMHARKVQRNESEQIDLVRQRSATVCQAVPVEAQQRKEAAFRVEHVIRRVLSLLYAALVDSGPRRVSSRRRASAGQFSTFRRPATAV